MKGNGTLLADELCCQKVVGILFVCLLVFLFGCLLVFPVHDASDAVKSGTMRMQAKL